MLSQNFILTCTPQATELLAGTHELVAELQERLSAGVSRQSETNGNRR
jgi:hypothetical protein